MMINPSRPWPQPLHSSKRFTGALCASLLGRLGLAGWVQQSSGMWGGGGSQVPQPWQVVTGRREGTDRSQVVPYFWAPCTAPCVPCHKMYNTNSPLLPSRGEKQIRLQKACLGLSLSAWIILCLLTTIQQTPCILWSLRTYAIKDGVDSRFWHFMGRCRETLDVLNFKHWDHCKISHQPGADLRIKIPKTGAEKDPCHCSTLNKAPN